MDDRALERLGEARPRRDAPRRRIPELDIAGDDQHGNATQSDGRADRVFQHIRQLTDVGDQLAIVAAFAEEVLRMGLLEISATDFGGRNLRCDREHGRAAAMRIEQAVDEMKVARPAGTGADRKLTGNLRLAGRREGGDLLVTDVNPFDLVLPTQRFRQAIEAVANDAKDASHARVP